MCGQDEFGVSHDSHTLNSRCSQVTTHANCILNVTNFSCLHGGNGAPIVYIQGGDEIHLAGFHLWFHDSGGGDSKLISHVHPVEGMLTIFRYHLLTCSVSWPP